MVKTSSLILTALGEGPQNFRVCVPPYLPASRTETVLVGADAVPAETANLVAACAGKEVHVIDLQGLHAERALHWILFHLRAMGHPMAQCGKWRRFTAVEGLGVTLKRKNKEVR